MRLDLDKLATLVVVFLTVLTLGLLGAYGALKPVAAELHLQAEYQRANVVGPSDSALVQRLAAALAGDITPTNAVALASRSQELDHRADRLLELTAVLALAGMVVALFTGRPARTCSTSATRPL